jgi:hypothetical protein
VWRRAIPEAGDPVTHLEVIGDVAWSD